MNSAKEKLGNAVRQITKGKRKTIDRADLTRAAVLVPIVCRGDEPHLILTKRAKTVSTHKGQISFPGGVMEPADVDATDNALREAEEEIGLDKNKVITAGMMDDFITVTGFVVTPVVGFVEEDALLEIDSREVDELFEVPFSFFFDSRNHVFFDGDFRFHRYLFGDHDIWGATAGIIFRFFEGLKKSEYDRREL